MFDEKLRARILGHLRGRNKVPFEDAEDVDHDAWVLVLENQSKFDPARGSLWNWVKYQCMSRDLLRPFTERLRHRREPLSKFFSDPTDAKKCAAEIGRWRFTVQRRIKSDLLFLRSLETHLTDGRPRAELIADGLVDFVGFSS